jgi:hypothetical protein
MNDPTHELADMQATYVDVLKARIKELEEALATVRELRAYDRKEIERLRNIEKSSGRNNK